ncbi:hypothetical protein B0T20DRAFT_362125 [Sordaria brevicollis]|uniref:Rhodopsin domain-containing protein n=1 Tax=Sordaria brevicollis TaxID=83679 RepID=A0AAE0P1Z9_SORBR|nr:hypothetical protein B0T20DRAFT_362125 [Sordaria brevicollis]
MGVGLGVGGDAHWALAVMWVLVGLVFVLLLLRLYTRIVCVAAYGVDDHIYMVAFIFLLLFTVFIHHAAYYGFGQTPEAIDDDYQIMKATLYECIGQTIAIVGMPIAKASLGAFILRLVNVPWHRALVWGMMVLISLASLAQVLCFWLACIPFKYVYDRRIPGGYCPIDTRPTSYILCASTVIVDLFFALFPWKIIWSLQMPTQEKITIGCSMSLGLIAAAAGIKRSTEVEGLYTKDYLRDTVGLIVWSAAEMGVTLICIGIPVCRPLYKRLYTRFRSQVSGSSSGYLKQTEQSKGDQPGYALRTIGGGVLEAQGRPPHAYNNRKSMSMAVKSSENEASDMQMQVKIGVSEQSRTTVIAQGRKRASEVESDGDSLEDYRIGRLESCADSTKRVLNDEEKGIDEQVHHSPDGITVTQTYTVDRN